MTDNEMVKQLSQEVQDLKQKLKIHDDMEAIRKLKAMYCHYCDGGWEGHGPSHMGPYEELFTEDGVWDWSVNDNTLYLNHLFEGKPLVREFIANTMIGIEYLWNGPVQLETSEVAPMPLAPRQDPLGGPRRRAGEAEPVPEIKWRRVVYTMENKMLTKKIIDEQ